MQGYEWFKDQIYKLTKLDLNSYKEKQMKRRIESLISRRGIKDYQSYFALIQKDAEAFDEFINFLTINVSEFYRNVSQWDALKNKVVPELLAARAGRIKVWSAACSTGEEPYSLVMLLSEFMPMNAIKIFACDFDTGAIAKAKLGLYTEKAIANVPENYKKKFFEKVGSGYRISDEVKSKVEFKKMNLLLDPYPEGFDLILCRNVMIYFTDEAKNDMYHKFNKSLVKGGYLLVGSTEQIIQPSKFGFESGLTFFYKKV